ncbi:hypothetical protein C8Q77DRAFT_1071506 [Trametes polyzona]|nr:hypothetical protein C8Q77DRAFT_1071506 [Trametes polyzona]
MSESSVAATQDAAFARYSSAAALATAVEDWGEVASYALHVAARATILINGGIPAETEEILPAVVITLAPGQYSPSRPSPHRPGQPVTLFLVRDISIVQKEKSEITRLCGKHWNGHPDRVELSPREQAAVQERPLIGFLPVFLSLAGVDVGKLYGICGKRRREPGEEASMSEWERVILQDVKATLIQATNQGIICAAGPGDRPDVGVLVRRKKKWEWKKLDNWKWEQTNVVSVHSGLDPDMLWNAHSII